VPRVSAADQVPVCQIAASPIYSRADVPLGRRSAASRWWCDRPVRCSALGLLPRTASSSLPW